MKGNRIVTPENAKAFERSMAMLDNCLQEIRKVAGTLLPATLLEFGLDRSLKDFCAESSQRENVKVNYQSAAPEPGGLSQEITLTAYRLVEQVINSFISNRQTTKLQVQLVKEANQLLLQIQEDERLSGSGLPGKPPEINWENIKQGVYRVNGAIDIVQDKEKGMAVYIRLNT